MRWPLRTSGVPSSGKLTVSAIVQAERGPHQLHSSLVQHSAVIQGNVESSQVRSAHVQANATMLVCGVKKVNVVPEFALRRWQAVSVRLSLHVEAIGLRNEVHIQPHAVRNNVERVSKAGGGHTQRLKIRLVRKSSSDIPETFSTIIFSKKNSVWL